MQGCLLVQGLPHVHRALHLGTLVSLSSSSFTVWEVVTPSVSRTYSTLYVALPRCRTGYLWNTLFNLSSFCWYLAPFAETKIPSHLGWTLAELKVDELSWGAKFSQSWASSAGTPIFFRGFHVLSRFCRIWISAEKKLFVFASKKSLGISFLSYSFPH